MYSSTSFFKKKNVCTSGLLLLQAQAESGYWVIQLHHKDSWRMAKGKLGNEQQCINLKRDDIDK